MPGESRGAELSRRTLEGYQRWPQADGGDAWGGLATWSATNTRRNLAALADEEEPRLR